MQISEEVEYRSPFDLKPHPLNDYYHSPLEESERAVLVASIEEIGIQEALWISADGMIVSGHERWKIAQKMGLKAVPVKIVEGVTDDEILYLLVSANEARRGSENDLIKKARKVKVMYQHWGIKNGNNQWVGHDDQPTQKELAELLGKSVRTINRLLKLLDLIPDLQNLVSCGVIGLTAGNELAALPAEEQLQIYQYIKRENIADVKTVEIQAIRKELEYLRERKPVFTSEQSDPSPLKEETRDDLDEEWVENEQGEETDSAHYVQLPSAPTGTMESERYIEEKGNTKGVAESLSDVADFISDTTYTAQTEKEQQERPWHGPAEPKKRAIDVVAPMFDDERNALNVRRRVMMAKFEKAERQLESLGKSLLPFFDDMVDNQDVVVREAVDNLTKRLELLSTRLKEVVNWS